VYETLVKTLDSACRYHFLHTVYFWYVPCGSGWFHPCIFSILDALQTITSNWSVGRAFSCATSRTNSSSSTFDYGEDTASCVVPSLPQIWSHTAYHILRYVTIQQISIVQGPDDMAILDVRTIMDASVLSLRYLWPSVISTGVSCVCNIRQSVVLRISHYSLKASLLKIHIELAQVCIPENTG
jgi:hypothetical protein